MFGEIDIWGIFFAPFFVNWRFDGGDDKRYKGQSFGYYFFLGDK
jgi:hypothetical protein